MPILYRYICICIYVYVCVYTACICICICIYCSIYDFIYEDAAPKRRRQLGRRDSDEAVNRQMAKHFAHLPTEIVETHKIDGLLIREVVKRDRYALPPGGRLGTQYWVNLASQISSSMGGLETLKPAEKEKHI